MQLFAVLGLLLFYSSAVAGSPSDCADACHTSVSGLIFTGVSSTSGWYISQCTNVLRVQSIFLCMRHYCTESEIEAGMEYIGGGCEEYGGVTLFPWSIISNISDAEYREYPPISLDNMASPTTYKTPVFVQEAPFKAALKTIVTWQTAADTRANYGYAMFGYFGIIIVVAALLRVVGYFFGEHSISCTRSFRTLNGRMKQHLSTPALVGKRAAEPSLVGTVPPRLQSLALIAFAIINFVLCCVHYDLFEGNLYWPKPKDQLTRYLADRAGVLAFCNLTLLWAFAMRNNVLIWLTGWSFVTFNQFHRWVARIATIEAAVHGICYTVFEFSNGGKAIFILQWAERYWYMGVISVIAMSFLSIFAVYPLRKHAYEVFLIIHILLAVLLLVAMWYHLEIFDGEYDPYIWACTSVWAFDRALRYGCVFAINRLTRKSTARYIEAANVIKVTVPVRNLVRPKPGTYYYVYLVSGLKIWECHPFTLSSWESPSRESQATNGGGSTQVTFMFRVFNGFTRRVRDRLVSEGPTEGGLEGFSRPIRLVIEGPYGHAHTVSGYTSVLFVVGGLGVTVALSHLQALFEAAAKDNNMRTRRIQLVWCVREESLLKEVYEQDLAPWRRPDIADKFDVRLDVYLTGDAGGPSLKAGSILSTPVLENDSRANKEVLSEKNEIESPTASEILPPSEVFPMSIFRHRLAVHDIVCQAAGACAMPEETLAVVSCGPGALADDVRDAAVKAIGRGYDALDLFPETFTW